MKMITNNKIAVLGGGGRTGKYIITELLRQGYGIKALLRNPETFEFTSPSIEILKGDALEPNAILSLTEGCQAILSTIGQRKDEPLVGSQATINVLNAMAEHNMQRYILVAGLNVDTPFDNKSPAIRAATEWMKASFPEIHADRQKTYSILSASNQNWTLVRVPLIEFTDTQGKIMVSLEDCMGNKISAGDIATFVIQQLTDDAYSRKSPFIANG